MNKKIEEYRKGINLVSDGKRINRNSVSAAMGKDPSLLNPSRDKASPWAPIVRQLIEDAEKERLKAPITENFLAKEKRIKEKYKAQKEDAERLLSEAYAREVMLIHRIDELERQLEAYEKNKILRMTIPRK